MKFKWTDVEQRAFEYIKHTVAHYTLLAYPDFNKRFDINMDTINYQLVAVITRDGKPISLYSPKLTETKTRYTVTEKEFISKVKTLKEFRAVLLGQQLKIFTNHKI